jgi:hypothetical protein
MNRFLVTLTVAAAGFSACGGSEGAEDSAGTSKAEYEEQFEQIRADLEPLSEDAEKAFKDGQAERGLNLMAEGTARLVDELESTEPPPAVAQAHDDFIASLKVFTDHMRATAEMAGDEGLRRATVFFVRQLPEGARLRNRRARRAFEREGYSFGNLQPSLPGQDTE